MVVLPQPEWPIRQTNSPGSTEKCRFSNTVVSAPSRPVNFLLMPSMRIRGSLMFGLYSGNVTSRVSLAIIRSSSMPTTPMASIAVRMLVIDRLFHSFHTK